MEFKNQNMKNHRLISIIFWGVSSWVWAQNNAPSSCRPIAVRGDSVMFSTTKPVLMIIHNLSGGDLWITHPVADPGASAGFSSLLGANQWSALVVDKKSFELTCIESKPGHEQQIACEGQLVICKWPKVKISLKQRGTYWAAENMNWSDLRTYLGGRGFSLPASANK